MTVSRSDNLVARKCDKGSLLMTWHQLVANTSHLPTVLWLDRPCIVAALTSVGRKRIEQLILQGSSIIIGLCGK